MDIPIYRRKGMSSYHLLWHGGCEDFYYSQLTTDNAPRPVLSYPGPAYHGRPTVKSWGRGFFRLTGFDLCAKRRTLVGFTH